MAEAPEGHLSIVTPATARLVRIFVFVWVAGGFAASIARADLPPINLCTAPGQPCGDDEACMCQATSCSRRIPCSSCGGQFRCEAGEGGNSAEDDGGSDGFCMAKYDCNLCMTSRRLCPTTAGAGGRGGAGAPSDGGTQAGEDDDGCSCAAASDDFTGGAFAVLGCLLWLVRRRRHA